MQRLLGLCLINKVGRFGGVIERIKVLLSYRLLPSKAQVARDEGTSIHLLKKLLW